MKELNPRYPGFYLQAIKLTKYRGYKAADPLKDFYRVTEDMDQRLTENGDTRVIESAP